MLPSLHKLLSSRSSVLVLLIVIWSATGCKKDTPAAEDEFNPAIAKTLLDETYGDGARQSADVYLPANRGNATPVVIMLHGGSWMEGNKSDLNDVINIIRAQWPEAAIINMNYKLANGTAPNYHPAQMNDIAQLITYLGQRRSLWQIGDKITIAGVSAGGHLGLLYSYAYNTGNQVKAVVSIVGPTDFSDPFYTTNLLFQIVATNLLGKTWTQDPDLHRSVSPALRVSATSPPTFMAYGGQDPIVPLSNATTLRNRLQANGIAHTYVEYPAEGHEFSPATISDLTPRVIQFLKQYTQ